MIRQAIIYWRVGAFAILMTALALVAAGVANAQSSENGDAPSAAAGAKPGQKIVGVWDGTTLAACGGLLPPDRCNAQQKVSITLVEGENSKLTGFYKCSYGTQDCNHLNETGKVIDASVNGSAVMMRVAMPDGTTCTFNGRPVNDKVNGGYVCTSGGAVIERGVWRAHRSY
jgi:hypothetical protein